MPKRTTVELDEELLNKAKRALGQASTRATIEEALRRATADAEAVHADRIRRQHEYLDRLSTRVDVDVLGAGDMWR